MRLISAIIKLLTTRIGEAIDAFDELLNPDD